MKQTSRFSRALDLLGEAEHAADFGGRVLCISCEWAGPDSLMHPSPYPGMKHCPKCDTLQHDAFNVKWAEMLSFARKAMMQ